MMTVLALNFSWPRLTRRRALRMVGGGAAWGVLLSAGQTALSFYGCGAICLDETIVTTALSVSVGILAIGPVAAFGRAD